MFFFFFLTLYSEETTHSTGYGVAWSTEAKENREEKKVGGKKKKEREQRESREISKNFLIASRTDPCTFVIIYKYRVGILVLVKQLEMDRGF